MMDTLNTPSKFVSQYQATRTIYTELAICVMVLVGSV